MTIKKKILLVSFAFYPEISPRSFRTTELAKEFCRQGHDVTVFSKFRDYDYSGFLAQFPVKLKMWKKPVFPRIPESKSRLFSIISRGLSRILLIFFEYPMIEEMFKVRKILKDHQGYDLLITFAYPHPVHWGTAWARSDRNRIANTWVADCGDPYMGDVLDSFRKPFYFGYLEKWFCKKADYISIPVESARSGYYNEFQSKIEVIPQGFDFNLNDRKAKSPENKITQFAYAGGFLRGIRDPDLLIQFLEKNDISFIFFIFTDKPELLDKYKSRLGEKLMVSGYIPREELINRLSKMDFLINFDNNTSVHIPSKLIDYAIANRPILNIDKGFGYNDILAFLKGDYSKRLLVENIEKFHIRNVSQRFLDLVKVR
jgi:hypothetical protein